jgi:uncharacterized damage-inducible protein DinB
MASPTLLLLEQQYELVKSSRDVLFTYCESIATENYVRELANFGRGSIRNLHVHIANAYQFWLSHFALQQFIPITAYESVRQAADVRPVYASINELMQRFLQHFDGQWEIAITGTMRNSGQLLTTTPLAVFTHVSTHEFHHKGQMLSMSRQFNHTPPDTDIIRLV